MRAVITPTEVDEEVAAMQRPHAGNAARDYSTEPMTLVEFTLTEADGVEEGVWLHITESGFDAVPADRRSRAFEANDAGWTHQTRLIQRYLALGERV